MLLGIGPPPTVGAVHAIVSAPKYEKVATHLFVEGDEYLDSDAVFRSKRSWW